MTEEPFWVAQEKRARSAEDEVVRYERLVTQLQQSLCYVHTWLGKALACDDLVDGRGLVEDAYTEAGDAVAIGGGDQT